MTTPLRYHPFILDLSPGQLDRLTKGMKIRLKHAQLSAGEEDDVLFLTKMQINRLTKARSLNKGADLQLSHAQLSHNAKHGSGKYSQFFAKIGNFVRDKALDGASALGSNLIKAGSKMLGATVKGLAPSSISKDVRSGLDSFVDAGIEAGGKWTASQLESFLKGLKSTKTGSGVLGGGVQPLKIDLQKMIKRGAGVRERPILTTAIMRPSTPFYIQNLGAAFNDMADKGGGALYPPGSKRRS